VSEQKKDIRFDKTAAKYDMVAGGGSRRFYDLILKHARLFPGASVLDAGCGTGTILRRMADACEIDGCGIDISESMITEAKRKCPQMTFYVARCDATPFDDGRFDVIVSCMAFHHFGDKEGFAKEAARLLKPGGMLYIADPRFPAFIRKAINGICRLLRVAGEFLTPEGTAAVFARRGFEYIGSAYDGYAQITILRR